MDLLEKFGVVEQNKYHIHITQLIQVQIKSRLIMLTKTIQNELEIEYLELTQNWKKNVSRMLVEVLNDNLELEQINERS